MAKTVVGYFDSFPHAERAADALVSAGFRREEISIVANRQAREAGTTTAETTEGTQAGEGATAGALTGAAVGGAAGLIASLAGLTIPVIGPVLAAGPIVAMLAGAGAGAVAGGLIGALIGLGIPEEEARVYEEALTRGGTLVILKSDDARAEQAAALMTQNGAVDIRRRAADWRQPGATATQREAPATQREGEIRAPVIEEEMRVGKRKVESGGVRVASKEVKKPVQEQVRLHEERVKVERRPADRPATPADLETHKGEGAQIFEFRETSEEPVIEKKPRVVEEVVVGKEARDRTETVRDTVRRKDVEVQPVGQHRGYEAFDTDFRNNYRTAYANTGASYDQYAPAYRYGYDLAGDGRYAGRNWTDVEPDARRDWEARHPGTWDRMKDAVQYGWNRVRESVT